MRTRHRGERGARSERGQATVELALALPVLLLLVFGIIEFGRIYGDYTILQSAAREAVRVAATGGDDDAVDARVAAAAPGLDPTRIVVDVDRDAAARLVTVRLSYPVDIASGPLAAAVGGRVQLSTSAVMAYDVGP